MKKGYILYSNLYKILSMKAYKINKYTKTRSKKNNVI